MEFEVGEHLAALLQATPWFTLALFALWPEKGIIALLIKRSQAVKVAEIERDKMRTDIANQAGQGSAQGSLPPPVGQSAPPAALPAPSGEEE